MCARVNLSACFCLLWFIGSVKGDCPLPQHPAHGRHQPHGDDCVGAEKPAACEGTPGTNAPEDWLLVVRCDPGYQTPDPESADVPSVCTNGQWSIQKLPECVIPDLLKHDREQCTVPKPPANTKYRMLPEECGGESLPQGSQVPHDCILFLYCDSGYRRSNGSGDYLTHCTNKTWNPPIPNKLCRRTTGDDVAVRPTETSVTAQHPTVVSLHNPPPVKTGCELPDGSTSRKYCSLEAGCEDCHFYSSRCLIPAGSRVDQVKVVCAPLHSTRYPLSGDVAVCRGDESWYPPLPECFKMCRPLVSEAHQLKCHLGADIVDCSRLALPNTTVNLQCANNYHEFPDLAREGQYRKTYTCKANGEWSGTLPPCKSGCGVSTEITKVTPQIFNGTEAYVGFFPWHAGLYYLTASGSWDQRCGGSLISDRLILTAAHCVSEVKDFNTLRIALGKYRRSWDYDEPNQQKRKVSVIRYPPQYSKVTFTFDIALLLLSEKVKLDEFIMPVCRDFDEAGIANIHKSNLYVVGWGKTAKNEKSSETLLYNSVQAMSSSECRKAVPSFFNTFEKICAKNTSVSITQVGDSGGGLTAVYNDGLHYIVGIVSTKLDSVNSNDEISMFTNIRWRTNLEWIVDEMKNLENYS